MSLPVTSQSRLPHRRSPPAAAFFSLPIMITRKECLPYTRCPVAVASLACVYRRAVLHCAPLGRYHPGDRARRVTGRRGGPADRLHYRSPYPGAAPPRSPLRTGRAVSRRASPRRTVIDFVTGGDPPPPPWSDAQPELHCPLMLPQPPGTPVVASAATSVAAIAASMASWWWWAVAVLVRLVLIGATVIAVQNKKSLARLRDSHL